MAYTEQGSEELLRFKKGSNTVVVRLVHNLNSDSIDIREHYETEHGELAPTKKGIRFNTENTLDVIRALVKSLENPSDALEILKGIE